MPTTIDAVSNVDFSGSLLAVSISGQTLNLNSSSVGDGTIKTGFIQVTTASGGTQLPDVSVRQSVRFERIVTGGNTWFGGLGSEAPYYDNGLTPSHKGMDIRDTAGNVNYPGIIKNLNTVRVVSDQSGCVIAWFGVD